MRKQRKQGCCVNQGGEQTPGDRVRSGYGKCSCCLTGTVLLPSVAACSDYQANTHSQSDLRVLKMLPMLVMVLLVRVTTPSLVTNLSPLVVRQGRAAYLHTGALQLAPLPESEQCKVEVVRNDPMTQRVGSLKPTVSTAKRVPCKRQIQFRL